MRVLDSMFWLLFSLSFVIFGIFPEIALFISSELGFVSASNFVFLYVIAVLVVRDFRIVFAFRSRRSALMAWPSQLRLIAMILSIVLLITECFVLYSVSQTVFLVDSNHENVSSNVCIARLVNFYVDTFLYLLTISLASLRGSRFCAFTHDAILST